MLPLEKDRSILDLLRRLDLDARGWILVDHWEADLCAVGIAHGGRPDRLVYVSTFPTTSQGFFYECEVSRADGYDVVATADGVSFAVLLDVLVGHLRHR